MSKTKYSNIPHFENSNCLEEPSISHIVSKFESIGDNCEFGIVQRYCGIEPLGLFRFTGTPIEKLIYALDNNLEIYGNHDDIQLTETADGSIICLSLHYGFMYNTGDKIGADRKKLLIKESRKINYLKRKFVEDLRSGEKIFVRKTSPSETQSQIQNLMRALSRYGEAQILFVKENRVHGGSWKSI